MQFKPHRKSNHPVNDKHTLYDDYSIYTPFTPAQPKKGGMPSDDITTQDNKTPPKHEPEDEQTKPQTPIIPLAFEPTRYVIHVHALKAPIGESAVVAIQCGVWGKGNNNFTEGQVMPVYGGESIVYLNQKPQKSFEQTIKQQVINPANPSNFPGLDMGVWGLGRSNIGKTGEFEYSTPDITLYVNFDGENININENNSGLIIDTLHLGVGIPLRTMAYNACSVAPITINYSGKRIFTRSGVIVTGTELDSKIYRITEYKLSGVSGTITYEGDCSGDHECHIHPTNDTENEDYVEKSGAYGLRIDTLTTLFTYSLYHTYLNWSGVIEYLGSLWVEDPALPVVHISRDNEDGLEVIITSPGISQHKTKYASAEYPATADFTNSFNTITISQPTAQTTVTYASNIIQWLTNNDSSQSKYYGLSELGYNALVVAAASVV